MIRKTATGMTMEMNAPALSRYQAEPRLPDSCEMYTVSGATPELPPRKTIETSRSFHVQRNWKMP